MKVTYECKKVNAVLEFEASDVKEVFDKLSHIQEIFEQDKCGNCNKGAFRLSRRDVSKGKNTYTYRELVCTSCGHRLSFGQKQADQSLFPQRNDKDGNPKGKNGWTTYSKDGDDE